jgi:hypothetical protein
VTATSLGLGAVRSRGNVSLYKTADARKNLKSIPNPDVSFGTASELTLIYRQHFCPGVLP